jgi:serine-type D-Ala-D-Ala carboxypeptidase (penicillin-binding protein 5/6)
VRRALLALATVLALVAVDGASPVQAAVGHDEGQRHVGPRVAAAVDATSLAVEVPEPPTVTARGAVLWDPADGVVLHGVAEDVPRPMASTTKIMTSLLALEAGTLEDVVVVSERAAAIGEASLDLRAGQEVRMRSLLGGLLVRSGNDAATAVAEHVAGEEAVFIDRMNARAAELGLPGTRFTSASGLTDDPAHLATPTDLARLAAHAMQDPVFAELAGAASLAVPGLPPMANRNELLGVYPGATGVKTGYTARAGLCLVASATREGRTLYAVVLGSTDSFGDVAALLDHGFDAYTRAEPAAEGSPVTRYRWADVEVPLIAEAALGATVPVGSTVTWRTRELAALPRPVAAGAPAGTVELLVDGVVRAEVPLRTAGAVAGRSPAPAATRAGGAVQEALRDLLRMQAIERAA